MTQTLDAMIAADFGTIGDVIRQRALEAPDRPAVVMESGEAVDYAGLDLMMDRVAAALQRGEIAKGEAVAVCATASIAYVALFLGALRAGVAVAPIAPSSSPEQIACMVADCGAKLLFLDEGVATAMGAVLDSLDVPRVALDDAAGEAFDGWLAGEGARPAEVQIERGDPFNIIYSSGTTGAPKGIVQSHGMRWRHIAVQGGVGFTPGPISLLSTPLYSNTTLVCFFPTLAGGGTVVLMKKFDAGKFLALSEQHSATHAMLVPVQYRRILEHPDFDKTDLTSFQMKFCTSAPFSAELKRQVLDRWPGGLVEYFGMTEGGGTCILMCHAFPDKLHTVGVPIPGHDIRVIDEDGRQLPPGEVGEIVGRSGATMNGYHGRQDKTDEATWVSPDGERFIRTGDVGRFDAEGFLTLMDRKKDMIISGGFNIYPSDLEAVIVEHPAVAEVAVIAAPSQQWGETPVAFVALKSGAPANADEIKAFANARLGKMQRVADVHIVEALPRSHIGKVLKRELRDAYVG